MSAVQSPPRRPTEGELDDAPARLTPPKVAEIAESIEAYSMEEMVAALAPEVAARYGVCVERIGSTVVQAATQIDVPFFNRVVGLGLTEPVTEATLDAIAWTFRGASVRFLVQMSPEALSEPLHARLEARGWARKDNWAQMIRGVEPPPEIPTDLRIERIGPAHAQPYAEVLLPAFDMPPEYDVFVLGLIGRAGWHCYAAFDGDTLVATGALLVRGEVGYLTFGATRATHRRRGAQGAIMARRIRDAGALGCRWLVTTAVEDTPDHPNPSYHNMLRTGFLLAYLRPNYVFFPG